MVLQDKGQWVYNQPGSSDSFQLYTYTYPSDHQQDQDRPWTYGSAQCTASNMMKIPVGFGQGSKKSTITYVAFPVLISDTDLDNHSIEGKSTMQVDWHPG